MTLSLDTVGPQIRCDGGPLDGSRLVIEWPWSIPPALVWLARLGDDRLVCLGPDKDRLNEVARRHRSGGAGWIPYRRVDPGPPLDGPWVCAWAPEAALSLVDRLADLQRRADIAHCD